MCWWTNFGMHVKDKESLRNIFVFITDHYRTIMGEDLTMFKSKNNVQIPHCIDNDEKPLFVAVIAHLLGDDIKVHDENIKELYLRSIKMAESLHEYKCKNDNGKDLANRIIMASQLIARRKIDAEETKRKKLESVDKEEAEKEAEKKDEYVLPIALQENIHKYAAALTEAIVQYRKMGPEGCFKIKFLYQELGLSSK